MLFSTQCRSGYNLIWSGTGLIKGRVTLVSCTQVPDDQLSSHVDKHRVEDPATLEGRNFAWVLEDPFVLPSPVVIPPVLRQFTQRWIPLLAPKRRHVGSGSAPKRPHSSLSIGPVAHPRPAKRRVAADAGEPIAESDPYMTVAANSHDKRLDPAPLLNASNMVLANRLVAGRTVPNLLVLMSGRLFASPPSDPSHAAHLQPRKGLFAQWKGSDAFILACYSAWSIPRADIIVLQQCGEVYKPGAIHRCRQDELSGVGVHFKLHTSARQTRGGLVFEKTDAVLIATPDVEERIALVQASAIQQPPPEGTECRLSSDVKPLKIMPLQASNHVEACKKRGEVHLLCRRGDTRSYVTILDFPFPIVIDARPLRCSTCRAAQSPDHTSYKLSESDIRSAALGEHAYQLTSACHATLSRSRFKGCSRACARPVCLLARGHQSEMVRGGPRPPDVAQTF